MLKCYYTILLLCCCIVSDCIFSVNKSYLVHESWRIEGPSIFHHFHCNEVPVSTKTKMECQDLPDSKKMKHWSAKRKGALVVEILQGKTTVFDAAHKYDLKAEEIAVWQEMFIKVGEKHLRDNIYKFVGELYVFLCGFYIGVATISIYVFMIEGR